MARIITGQSLEIRTIHQLTQTFYSIDTINLLHSNTAIGADLKEWLLRTLECEDMLADRYVKRVLLERALLSGAVDHAIANEFPSNKSVRIFRLALLPTSSTHDVKEMQGIGFISSLLTWIIAPIVLYARIGKEFFTHQLSLGVPTIKKYDLTIYEVGYQPLQGKEAKNEGPLKSMQKKNNSSLIYSYDKSKTCQFINDIWRPSQRFMNEYKKKLSEDGYSFIDWADFKLTFRRVLLAHQLWFAATINCLKFIHKSEYVFDAARCIGLCVREQIIFDNINTTSILGFDDYSERAIIRTHVARQKNCKTFLAQHSANDGLRSGPELTTVITDYYLTMSAFARESFASYWPEKMIIPYGYPRLDPVINLINTNADTIRAELEKQNPGKPVVIFTLPKFTSPSNFVEKFKSATDFLDFLKLASERYRNTLNFYIRPKNLARWEDTILPTGLSSAHMLVNPSHLTGEFISASDLVICNSGSGVLSECALLKTPCAQFDFRNADTNMFENFGENFFLKTTNQLTELLDQLAAGEPLGLNTDLIFKKFNDPYNADRNKVIQKLIHTTF